MAIGILFLSSPIVCQINSQAPVLKIQRDDHVATLEMDFNPGAGWGGQLWNVGTDGKDAVGYLIKWWPDDSEIPRLDFSNGCSHDKATGTSVIASQASPYRMVSANPVVQLQPVANDVLYHLEVVKVNGRGQICSPPSNMDFMGGSSARVNELKTQMTFFDDFNLAMGPAEEKKWNHAAGPQTDPRFNLFFINGQCHVHTLNGTLNGAAGDKSVVAERARKPILFEEGSRRRIVFDMDGIFSGRSVWYLDFNPVETDLTGHASFFDFDGDAGLPADVCRLKASGHSFSVSLINGQGESYKIAEAHLPDFDRAMMTNVRRSFDVSLGPDGIRVLVDSVEVINAVFPPGSFKPGVYSALWSTVGYNTSKDDNPYFLSHWDNFGFDGPDLSEKIVHNYVSQISGSDLKKTYREWNGTGHPATYILQVPDDIHPLVEGVSHEVYLVWSYLKNDYSYFSVGPSDSVWVNGKSFALPTPGNNTTPLNPDRVSYDGSAISNRLKIEDLILGQASLINLGDNKITFLAENTGIVNLHLEVHCPNQAPEPAYTPPSAIHHFVHHGELPRLGPSARIAYVNEQTYDWREDDTFELNENLSDTINVEVLVGNNAWADWAPNWLHQPSTSAEMWSMGSTPGIKKVNLFIKPKTGDQAATLLAELKTDVDAPIPQLRYVFRFNSKPFPDGAYEIYTIATAANGILSHPAYPGFGFRMDASEMSGAITPVTIHLANGTPTAYVFNGQNGFLWTDAPSWESGVIPPTGYNGNIIIDAHCEIPQENPFTLGPGGHIRINPGKTLTVK